MVTYHTNLRRVFPTWRRAMVIANCYGWQVGVKHRVSRERPGVWIVTSTGRPVTVGRVVRQQGAMW